eukprot:1533248-Pleurochrysis_carterae.AAC.1
MPDASSSDLSAISSAEIEMASWADVRAADTRARHRVHVEAVMAAASARVPPTDLVSMQRSQNHSHSGTLASGTRRQNRWYVASQPSHSSSCAESLPEPHTCTNEQTCVRRSEMLCETLAHQPRSKQNVL